MRTETIHMRPNATDTACFIFTSTRFDFEAFRRRQRDELGPGHVVMQLADSLGATVVQPGDDDPDRLDHLLSKIIGEPEHWATARRIVPTADENTVLYATGNDVGMALAFVSIVRRSRSRLGVYFVNPERTRDKWLAKLVSRFHRRLFVATGTADKQDFLTSWLGDRVEEVVLAIDQTDTSFFAPGLGGPATPSPVRTIVASCGLEQRDYVTLAAATSGLDVDVRVCAVSPNFSDRTAVAIPDELPANMELRHYEFDELRALYRTAGVTVLPLLPNDFSAGLTAMLEAIATGSPVIITDNPGLAHEMIALDLVIGVPPEDPAALRDAIKRIADDPAAASVRADRAREWVLENHSTDTYVKILGDALT